jgi:hypothetical protein
MIVEGLYCILLDEIFQSASWSKKKRVTVGDNIGVRPPL